MADRRKSPETQSPPAGEWARIPLDRIEPDPNQARRLDYEAPRRMGDEDSPPVGELADDLDAGEESYAVSLADSILTHGVLQPIHVVPIGPDRYRIVFGERRWRAAVIARDRLKSGQVSRDQVKSGYDFETIPVLLSTSIEDGVRTEIQLVENLQRLDMPAHDVWRALEHIKAEHKKKTGAVLSDPALARRLGRNETWVRDMRTAGSEEGRALAKKVGYFKSWQAIRRLLTQKATNPEVYDEVLRRVEGGELFDRPLLDKVVAEFKDKRRARRLDEIADRRAAAENAQNAERVKLDRASERKAAEEAARRRQAEEETAAEIEREEEERSARASEEDFRGQRQTEVSPSELHESVEDEAESRPRDRREQGKALRRRAGESDLAWLIRRTATTYVNEFEEVGLDAPTHFDTPSIDDIRSSGLPFFADVPDQSPPQPAVRIPLALTRSQAELLAGLLDDLLAGRAKPKAHRVENITPADIAKRIAQLMEEAEKRA